MQKACKSCRSRQELSSDIQEEFAKYVLYMLRSLVQIVIFQSLSMSLFLNLLFETDGYSNRYLLAKFGFDAAEKEPLEIWKFGREFGNLDGRKFLL